MSSHNFSKTDTQKSSYVNHVLYIFSDIDLRRQKRNPVMRSMSDRRDKDSQEVFNFKDTTALRKKTQRTIPSQLFQKPKTSIYQRPSCPPPSCPPTQIQDVPQRPPRQQSNLAKII